MEIENRSSGAAETQGRPWWFGYAIAIVLEVVLTAGLVAVYPYFPLANHPVLYAFLLMGIAYWFGTGPAILALVVSFVAFDYFFLPPYHTIWPLAETVVAWTRLAAFFLGTLLIGVATLLIRRSQRRIIDVAEELRQSEERFHTIFDSINDTILIHDADTGTIIDVNERACQVLGRNREDLIGSNVGLISSGEPPYTEEEALARIKRAIAGEPQTMEWQSKDKSGRLSWVEVSLRSATIGGRMVVLAVTRDISERKRADEALRESEERYRHIVETSQEGVWLIDADAVTTYVNQRMAEMLGYTRDEILGRSTLDFVHENWVERAKEGLARRRLGVRGQSEVCYLRKDGTELCAIVASSPLMDDSGRFIGALGMITDITERKRTEQALRESEARFAMAQGAAEIGTWEHDLASGTIIGSDNLWDMFGVPPSDQLPDFEEWLRMIHPDDRERVQNGLTRALSDGATFSTEYRAARPDGQVRWFMARARIVHDDGGAPVRIIGIIMDITETVELRQALQRQVVLLQRALVPPLPSVTNGYRAAAVYLPASPGENVGGDLYDLFTTECGHIAVMIGDVAGKGIEAAALAAAARSTIRSLVYHLCSPGDTLSHADAVLRSQAAESEGFVTTLLFTIEPATGILTFASAGHPPAAIRRTNGQVEFLPGGGPPVGVTADHVYGESENHLDPGDQLILYTDGVLESRRGPDIFETEGIERTLVEQGYGTPDDVASGLLAAARDWAGGQLSDDAAIVVVERT